MTDGFNTNCWSTGIFLNTSICCTLKMVLLITVTVFIKRRYLINILLKTIGSTKNKTKNSALYLVLVEIKRLTFKSKLLFAKHQTIASEFIDVMFKVDHYFM